MLNIEAMRCVGGGGGVSPSSDNSRRKNRAVCSYLFCCLCVLLHSQVLVCDWGLLHVYVWARKYSYVCVYVHIFVFACIMRSAAEKDTAVAQ